MSGGWKAPTRRLVQSFNDDPSVSARVLLTTIFGDVVLPRRAAIAVQSLARLVSPLGISERLVRTSLQRMAEEKLVVAERVGRRSFYQVHDDARATFERADARIYYRRPVAWDRQWTVAAIDPASSDDTSVARLDRELRWLGMGPIGSHLYVSATVGVAEVSETAIGNGVPLAVLMRGPLAAGTLGEDARLTRLADPEGVLHGLHRWHLDTFGDLVPVAAVLGPEEAFLVRTLLVTGWRRIALRTTDLPEELLPSSWLGLEAYELTAALYRSLGPASETYLDSVLSPVSAPAPDRFSPANRLVPNRPAPDGHGPTS